MHSEFEKSELWRYVRPISTDPEQAGVTALLEKAGTFLQGFAWAKERKNIWVAHYIPGVFGLFLVELNTHRGEPEIDQFIWVVVGDLPPAYLSSVYAKSPRRALDGYMGEMKAWVDAVENQKPVEDLIPVNGAPTLANARALQSRLAFLSREILPHLPGED
jgi:hypothetical protein